MKKQSLKTGNTERGAGENINVSKWFHGKKRKVLWQSSKDPAQEM